MAVLGFWTRLAFALIVALLAVPTAGRAADGAVVTVTGLVDKVNRPPFDAFTDGFFAHYGVAFDKAHAFSGRDLARLGMRTIVLSYPNWSKPVTFRGPRLSAVLRAAGARGHKISVQALDGYFAEFPWAFSENDKVILAIEVDGRPLDIGGRGPAWLVFPPALQAGEGKEDDAGLVWGAFHIKIE
ncbi:molybdopterin-dependent oxidoreductase [Telmatospirillum siberiense]|nr:molybdopterin-dependent oxidoreductase [Telmatospirillum siberiense]